MARELGSHHFKVVILPGPQLHSQTVLRFDNLRFTDRSQMYILSLITRAPLFAV